MIQVLTNWESHRDSFQRWRSPSRIQFLAEIRGAGSHHFSRWLTNGFSCVHDLVVKKSQLSSPYWLGELLHGPDVPTSLLTRGHGGWAQAWGVDPHQFWNEHWVYICALDERAAESRVSFGPMAIGLRYKYYWIMHTLQHHGGSNENTATRFRGIRSTRPGKLISTRSTSAHSMTIHQSVDHWVT